MRGKFFGFWVVAFPVFAILSTGCQTRRAGLIVPCPTMSQMARVQLEDACGTDLIECPMVAPWVQSLARYCIAVDPPEG